MAKNLGHKLDGKGGPLIIITTVALDEWLYLVGPSSPGQGSPRIYGSCLATVVIQTAPYTWMMAEIS